MRAMRQALAALALAVARAAAVRRWPRRSRAAGRRPPRSPSRSVDSVGMTVVRHGPRGRLLHARPAVREGVRRRGRRAGRRSSCTASSARACASSACGSATSALELTEYLAPQGPADAGRLARQRPLVPARRDHRQRHGSRLRAAARSTASSTRRPARSGCRTGIPAPAASRRSTSAIPTATSSRSSRFPPARAIAKWHAPRRPRCFLGIDHTAIVVGDTDASAAPSIATRWA